jgi:arginase
VTDVAVIGAPTSMGAHAPGQEQAPAALRTAGIVERLPGAVDLGDTTLRRWAPDREHRRAQNAAGVVASAREVAERVDRALRDGRRALVLGGDCTVELGTVAGSIVDGASVCLAYVDLDTDLNTPETGDGVLGWMGVAHLLDVPGALDSLAGLGRRRPLLEPSAVRVFAAENITPPEQAMVDRLGLHLEPLAAVVEEPEAVLDRTRAWVASYDRLLVHVDIDVLDYTKFPIAEEVRSTPGLELRHLTRLLRDLCGLDNWRALTVTQIDPDHAPDQADSFRQLIGMLVDALGGRRD